MSQSNNIEESHRVEEQRVLEQSKTSLYAVIDANNELLENEIMSEEAFLDLVPINGFFH